MTFKFAAIAVLAAFAIGFGSAWSWRGSRCDEAVIAAKLAGRTLDVKAGQELGERAMKHADDIAAADAKNREEIRASDPKPDTGCVAGAAGLERLRRIK